MSVSENIDYDICKHEAVRYYCYSCKDIEIDTLTTANQDLKNQLAEWKEAHRKMNLAWMESLSKLATLTDEIVDLKNRLAEAEKVADHYIKLHDEHLGEVNHWFTEYEKSESALAQSRAEVAEAKKRVEEAKLLLNQTRIYIPYTSDLVHAVSQFINRPSPSEPGDSPAKEQK